MDPQVFDPMTWFTTVGGIGLAVWAVIEVLKRTATEIPVLKKVPIWVYAVGLSGFGTWLAHSVLHTLDGELGALLAQSVMTAMVASGGREWALTITKSLDSSVNGVNTLLGNGKKYVAFFIAATMLSGLACSARQNQAVVTADKQTADYLIEASQMVSKFCPAPENTTSPLAKPCLNVQVVVREALATGREFNTAAQARQFDKLGPLVAQIAKLQTAVVDTFDGAQEAQLTATLGRALAVAYEKAK
jgi:hypothetical protein